MKSRSSASTICIVTPGYLCSTPRVVKEADALSAAGFSVRVVTTQGDLEERRAHDLVTAAGKAWQWIPVGWSNGNSLRFPYTRLRRRMFQLLPARLPVPGVLERAEGRLYPELARAAGAQQAELFIGHYPVGLAAAARAATRWNARLVFDAEDLHHAEPPATKEGRRAALRIDLLQKRYLPRCSHVSVASELFKDDLRARYGCQSLVAVPNAFSVNGAERPRREGRPMSIYWFSQTIGLDRGLQDLIQAAGHLSQRVEVHLRGSVSEQVRTELLRIASTCGVAGSLFFHPQIAPDLLPAAAMEHDVGFAGEPPVNRSRELTISNKLFAYLSAGLAVAATDLPGQRLVLQTAPAAGFLYRPGDVETLASGLQGWLADPAELQNAQRSSLQAARTTWNWEHYAQKLVAAVAATLDAPPV